MTTAIVPSELPQVPAHLAKRIGTGAPSAMAAALAAGLPSGGLNFPRLSIRGARFRVIEGETETVLPNLELPVIIVGANPRVSKVFYAEAYDPDNKDAKPTCLSTDGVSPDPDSAAPQCAQCAGCPQAAWGSKITPRGKKAKACSDVKHIALVAANDPEGPIYRLTVSPTALRNLAAYQKELALRGIPPEVVQTILGFDATAEYPLLTFRFGGFLDEATQAIADGLFGSDAVKEVTGELELEAAPAPAPVPVAVAVAVPVAAPSTVAAPAQEQPAQQNAPAAAASAKKAAKPRVVKPKAEPVVVEASGSLADEVLDLLGGMDDE